MASIFSELYSDFLDDVKVYPEKLDVTAISFMRRFTRAVQEFQRDTEYIEAIVKIDKNPQRPYFILPRIAIRVLEIRDSTGRPILLNEYLQWSRNTEIQRSGYFETPIDDDYRVPYYRRTALATIYDREIAFQGMEEHDFIHVYYIPDLPAFTAPEATPDMNDIWQEWYPLDDNFMDMFTTKRLRPELSFFERAFLDKTIAMYIRSLGNINYRVYEERYKEEVANAIAIKPTYWKSAVTDYFLAPYS